eukprot:12403552-Karenia_brevis.AAC.1
MLLCESSVFTKSQTLLTISRAYWDQNLKVASLLWARSALARHHLGARRMDGGQQLFLRVPELFSQLLDDVKLDTLEKDEGGTKEDSAKRQVTTVVQVYCSDAQEQALDQVGQAIDSQRYSSNSQQWRESCLER